MVNEERRGVYFLGLMDERATYFLKPRPWTTIHCMGSRELP